MDWANWKLVQLLKLVFSFNFNTFDWMLASLLWLTGNIPLWVVWKKFIIKIPSSCKPGPNSRGVYLRNENGPGLQVLTASLSPYLLHDVAGVPHPSPWSLQSRGWAALPQSSLYNLGRLVICSFCILLYLWPPGCPDLWPPMIYLYLGPFREGPFSLWNVKPKQSLSFISCLYCGIW